MRLSSRSARPALRLAGLGLLLAACSPAGSGGAEQGSSSGEAGSEGSSTVATPTTGDAGTTGASAETLEDPTTGGPWELGECNPVDPTMCALPYPSLFNMRAAETPTGYQVAYSEGALPRSNSDKGMDPRYLNEKDGFSVLGALLFSFPAVDLAGTLTHETFGDYLKDDVKTVLLDAETGARVPHFVELDMRGSDPAERLIVVQPVTPLEHGKRYVFGVRGLGKQGGGLVEASPGFAALRDKVGSDDMSVEGQRVHYNLEVFPALAEAGFERQELQIAWDFVTVSRENTLGRMEWLRDDVLDAIGPDGPDYEISSIEDADCGEPGVTIGRTLMVKMTTPLYSTADEAGTLLTRDPDTGMPFRNGTTEVEVMLRIPCSLIDQDVPRAGRVLQYGHGLLGGKGEAKGGYLSAMADANGWVILASDWTGMKSADLVPIVQIVAGDTTNFPAIPERSMQGFTEFIAAMRMTTGKLRNDPALTFTGKGGSYSAIDPEKRSYYGNSQGGILGGAYLALSPDIDRGVLGVGGMPYVLLLPRSADFDQFFGLLKGAYDDQRDIMLLIALFQNLWDPGEGAGWAWAMNRDPSPTVGAKQVLMQVAIGDAQVTNIGAHIQARAFGASTIAPQFRPIWGVEEQPSGFAGSAFVEWNYTDVPEAPSTNTPPNKDFDPHECPRREPAAQQQLREFLEDGVVNQHCDGVCEGLRQVTCG
jgi:hypothetical protein